MVALIQPITVCHFMTINNLRSSEDLKDSFFGSWKTTCQFWSISSSYLFRWIAFLKNDRWIFWSSYFGKVRWKSFVYKCNFFLILFVSSSLWLSPSRSKFTLNCTQEHHNSLQSPLLPPSTIVNSPDASINGFIRAMRFKNSNKAKEEYHRMKNLPSSARRHRKFVFGALYEQLFSGYFEVDPRKGDFELIVRISSEESSKLYVSIIDPDEGVGKENSFLPLFC